MAEEKMYCCEICGCMVKPGRKYCRQCRIEKKRKQAREYQARRRRECLYRDPGIKKEELIERKCLKCERKFTAQGRFNRICPSCTVRNEQTIDYGARYAVVR